jgi:hypothetical protein
MAAALVLALGGVIAAALAATAVAAADPEPLPSGLESLGSASPNDVVRALRKVRHHYGDDAIVLETQLLMNAMQSGSVRGTGVRVDGVRTHDDRKKYLVFVVDTGLVFDSATRDETTRIHLVWEKIMVPTLARLQALRVPADGIKVEMRYHHRPYRSHAELRASLDEVGTPEETDFYVLVPDIDALAAQSETPHSLLTRAKVTVDGAPRTVPAAPASLPAGPGPD